jgi:hypothetical protein
MNQLDLSYTLSKQVPAMERGFTIATSYGDIVIEAGALAESLAAIVKHELQCRMQGTEPAAASIPEIGRRRRVDDFKQVHFDGLSWSLRDVPWAGVGDVVLCFGSGQSDVLRVSSAYSEHPDAYVPRSQDVANGLASTLGLPGEPPQAILGGDYAHRPAAAPTHTGSFALCQGCPLRAAAQQIHAIGLSA